ncbi:MAG TPA: 4a-hydroxytetrahydrobiopterin dehydratase [Candidatus Thermoplasmatota archaeon]|jgi:4a-hydroxytetrahydrobiopterin dehydratase|nr:4a-hydroxytetrahydrobiopterin dehydratase [Candidatus Thermoplasmatota archaeon]
MPRRPKTARGRTATRARARAPRPRARATAGIAVPEGWTLAKDGKSIEIEVRTKDFVEAMDLLLEIGRVAEDLEHHPDFHLERWNHVRIVTYSHDVGKLTERDERLAARITELLDKRGLTGA